MLYPVSILSSWLLNGIVEYTPVQANYYNTYLSKNYIAYKTGSCSLPWTPLVRILAFSSTTDLGEVIAIVHDAGHKIIARLTRRAVIRFEQSYGQRITFETVNRLIILRQASLKFIGHADRAIFARALASLGISSVSVPAVYLEVDEMEFYVRDRLLVSGFADNTLVSIYKDPSYTSRFQNNVNVEVQNEFLSDDEQIEAGWEKETSFFS